MLILPWLWWWHMLTPVRVEVRRGDNVVYLAEWRKTHGK